jgi:hypothetical protein
MKSNDQNIKLQQNALEFLVVAHIKLCAKNFIAFYKKNSSTIHTLQNGLCNCDLKANFKNSQHEIIVHIKQKETTSTCATLESKTTKIFFQNFHMIISRVWTLRLVIRLF